ncbi:MAG: hypothetical protein HYW48_05605 [Deltaproteobacteria bacterium]|nr:hypothetical protein [Deltaproteobacteria bacterium]
MRKTLAVLSFLFCTVSLPASDLEQQAKVRNVEGAYEVQSIQRQNEIYKVEFGKFPREGSSPIVLLEVQELSEGLLKQGDQVFLSAKVLDIDDKKVEALQVFLILPRGQSKTKVWLLSRKGKDLNLEGISFLHMHNEQDDPKVY